MMVTEGCTLDCCCIFSAWDCGRQRSTTYNEWSHAYLIVLFTRNKMLFAAVLTLYNQATRPQPSMNAAGKKLFVTYSCPLASWPHAKKTSLYDSYTEVFWCARRRSLRLDITRRGIGVERSFLL